MVVIRFANCIRRQHNTRRYLVCNFKRLIKLITRVTKPNIAYAFYSYAGIVIGVGVIYNNYLNMIAVKALLTQFQTIKAKSGKGGFMKLSLDFYTSVYSTINIFHPIRVYSPSNPGYSHSPISYEPSYEYFNTPSSSSAIFFLFPLKQQINLKETTGKQLGKLSLCRKT